MFSISKETLRINGEIRAREVRVTDAQGEQLGIMSTRDALRKAEEAHLDLVEVAPKAKPPVCRIMDFGKYRYEQQKREKGSNWSKRCQDSQQSLQQVPKP